MKPRLPKTTLQESQGSVDFDKRLLSFIKIKQRYSKVRFIIKELNLWNSRDNKSGNTLLHIAARHNNDVIAEYLIKSGSQVDVQNKSGKTPLIVAIEKSCKNTTEVLVKAGANIYYSDDSGKNALQWFLYARGFGAGMAQIFLNKVQADYFNDNAKIAIILYNADWPLYHVVLLKNIEVTRLMLRLLGRGYSVDISDKKNQTALHKSVQLVDVKHVELLLNHQADPNAMDDAHRSPLYYVYDRERRHSDAHLKILKLLIARNAKLSLTANDNSIWSQIDVTLKYGTRAAIEILLRSDLKIDYEVDENSITTPIHILATNQNPDIFKALDDRISNVNARDRMFQRILWIAATYGNASTIEYLLKRGVDVNFVDNRSRSALHCAVINCITRCDQDRHKECVEVLLEHGADVQLYEAQLFHASLTVLDYIADLSIYDVIGKIVVAHLVVRETSGKLIVSDHVQRILDTDRTLKTYYELCQQQLTIVVDRSMTLLDLLVANEIVFERYVRDPQWVSKMQQFCRDEKRNFCYLDKMLLRRIDRAVLMIKLRMDSAWVVSDIVKIEYVNFHLVADTIVNYLRELDLENLLKVPS